MKWGRLWAMLLVNTNTNALSDNHICSLNTNSGDTSNTSGTKIIAMNEPTVSKLFWKYGKMKTGLMAGGNANGKRTLTNQMDRPDYSPSGHVPATFKWKEKISVSPHIKLSM